MVVAFIVVIHTKYRMVILNCDNQRIGINPGVYLCDVIVHVCAKNLF